MTGAHVADPTEDRDLQEQLALSLLIRSGRIPSVIVHGGHPDMETRAQLINEGFQTAKAWDAVDDIEADDVNDRVDAMIERSPEPVVFTHLGKPVAVLILEEGWSFPRPQTVLNREDRGQLVVKRRTT
jgi:hypothetical protein